MSPSFPAISLSLSLPLSRRCTELPVICHSTPGERSLLAPTLISLKFEFSHPLLARARTLGIPSFRPTGASTLTEPLRVVSKKSGSQCPPPSPPPTALTFGRALQRASLCCNRFELRAQPIESLSGVRALSLLACYSFNSPLNAFHSRARFQKERHCADRLDLEGGKEQQQPKQEN